MKNRHAAMNKIGRQAAQRFSVHFHADKKSYHSHLIAKFSREIHGYQYSYESAGSNDWYREEPEYYGGSNQNVSQISSYNGIRQKRLQN